MHIRSKILTVSFKFILAILCGLCTSLIFSNFGTQAWRMFPTWVTLLGAIYFFIAALVILVRKCRADRTPCPMLEGMIISNLFLSSVTQFFYPDLLAYQTDIDSWPLVLIYIILPILTLSDWLLFARKGRWRVVEPFYWLALPLTYAATMIFTAALLPKAAALPYPLTFLDISVVGLGVLCGWLAIFAVIQLSFSYLIVIIDALTGGKISRYIVLPRIKTVVVDDTARGPVELKPTLKAKTPKSSKSSKNPQNPKTPRPKNRRP